MGYAHSIATMQKEDATAPPASTGSLANLVEAAAAALPMPSLFSPQEDDWGDYLAQLPPSESHTIYLETVQSLAANAPPVANLQLQARFALTQAQFERLFNFLTERLRATPPGSAAWVPVASVGGARRGTWTEEEEQFTSSLVYYFNEGLLNNVIECTTLRAFLSSRLRCDRMRITKKFRGMCFGKKYRRAQATPENNRRTRAAEAALCHLEQRFLRRASRQDTQDENDGAGPSGPTPPPPPPTVEDEPLDLFGAAAASAGVASSSLTTATSAARKDRVVLYDKYGRPHLHDRAQVARLESMFENPTESLLIAIGEQALAKILRQARNYSSRPGMLVSSARLLERTTMATSEPMGNSTSTRRNRVAHDTGHDQALPNEKRLRLDSAASSSSFLCSTSGGVPPQPMDEVTAGRLLVSFCNTENRRRATLKPWAGPASSAHIAVPPAAGFDAADKRAVLVAGACESTRALLSGHFTRAGFRVKTAAEGHAALAALKSEHFGVAFLDMDLPGLDAVQCTTAFRAVEPQLCAREPGRKRQPICVLTNQHTNHALRDSCSSADVDFFEPKPTQSKLLLTIVEHCIKMQS